MFYSLTFLFSCISEFLFFFAEIRGFIKLKYVIVNIHVLLHCVYFFKQEK